MSQNPVTCPNCAGTDLFTFYTAGNVPVNSCIMLDNAKDALNYPLGDINLEFCNHCSFIFNSSFNEALIEYSPRYEDQQIWSNTFNSFHESLARKIVNDCNLYNKKILEVGCGKGDFLELICRIGNNTGTGIDPAVNMERIAGTPGLSIEWIPEKYSARFEYLKPDFICCRHTLEHIYNTRDFINLLYKTSENNNALKIMFEVPDTTRVINNSSFQDIYYEHCSYFIPASLDYLFSEAGFSIEKIFNEYNDQYLVLIGSLSGKRSLEPHVIDSSRMKTAICSFESSVREKIKFWRNVIESYREKNRNIIIWGSGSKCVSFLSTVKAGTEHITIVDINPYRRGKYPPGIDRPIMSPEDIDTDKTDLVIVMNNIYLEEIRKKIGSSAPGIRILALD